jgi:hypothetical protein
VENVEDHQTKNFLTENEMDTFILSNKTAVEVEQLCLTQTPSSKKFLKARESTSRGNSPPNENGETTDLQNMLTKRHHMTNG